MSQGGDTRFVSGQSGNPKGRPKKRRDEVAPSAFEIVFDKTLTVTQNGEERELSVDEALQLKTYEAALKGSRLAVREVLKMIHKRELALAKDRPRPSQPLTMEFDCTPENANDALRILGVIPEPPREGPHGSGRQKIATWAAQAALSRPGRAAFSDKDIANIRLMTIEPDRLKWPRARS